MGSDFEIKDGELSIRINPSVYDLERVYATAYVFLDKFYFIFDGDKEKEIIVRAIPKNKEEDISTFAQTFFNELLSISNYFTQLEKNKDVINAVLQRALFSVSPKLVDEAEEAEINKIIEEIQQDVTK